MATKKVGFRDDVEIPCGAYHLSGTLSLPTVPRGLVLFAHGSGSSRFSPRNQAVAGVLQAAGLGTLLFDLLTPEEERVDAVTRELRFNIPLLAGRLEEATRWALGNSRTRDLAIGYFGASTGAAAALTAVTRLPGAIGAVVSRGGRPDLAGEHLALVQAPTLLIVGENDVAVIEMNKEALEDLTNAPAELAIVPGATHLFEEPGALEEVARLARAWFLRYLPPAARGLSKLLEFIPSHRSLSH